MSPGREAPKTVDDYLAGFPKHVQAKLQTVRRTIRKAAPEAERVINYQIAGYKWNGNLIFFAGYTNRIGLYPVPAGTKEFQKRPAPYRHQKYTIRFPWGKPISLGVVRDMVKFCLKEQRAKER
jgi:uncharacterized protein YdhG (YjbR/CyaY superfamily)